MSQYILKGRRPGFDLQSLTRVDKDDGYSEFLRLDGTCCAVVRTDLLRPVAPLDVDAPTG